LRRRQPSRRATLSVLLANYNDSRFLPRVLSSLAAQSRPPDEILLGDDASTDDSVSVMEAFSNRCPRVRIVRGETNVGNLRMAARLLSQARGDYVMFLSSDDYVLPAYVETLMRLAELHPEAAQITTAITILKDKIPDQARWCMDGQTPTIHPRAQVYGMDKVPAGYVSPERYRHYLETNPNPSGVLSGSAIYRRSLISGFGGIKPEFGIWEMSRLFYLGGLQHGLVYWPAPLFCFLLRRQGWTVQARAKLDDAYALLDRVHATMAEHPHLFSERFRKHWLTHNRFVLTL
jgi:glycosyltransferase involved in cell wall biosynthesis